MKKKLQEPDLAVELQKKFKLNKFLEVGFSREIIVCKISLDQKNNSIRIRLKSKGLLEIIRESYKKIPNEDIKVCVSDDVSFSEKGILLKNELSRSIGMLNYAMVIAADDLREKQEKLKKKINKFFNGKKIAVSEVDIYFSKAQWHVLIKTGESSILLSDSEFKKILSLIKGVV